MIVNQEKASSILVAPAGKITSNATIVQPGPCYRVIFPPTTKSNSAPISSTRIVTSDTVLLMDKKLKQMLVEYKGGGCIRCGYSKCLAALEFHHRDPSQKDFAVNSVGNVKFDLIKPEIDKCDLVCANCHREIHVELRLQFPPKKIRHSRREPAMFVRQNNSGRPSKIKWPSVAEMKRLVVEMPYTKISKILGVSDVAVKKHCDKIGISVPLRGKRPASLMALRPREKRHGSVGRYESGMCRCAACVAAYSKNLKDERAKAREIISGLSFREGS